MIDWVSISKEAHGRMQFLPRGVVFLEAPHCEEEVVVSSPDVFLWRKDSTAEELERPTSKTLRRYMWNHRNDRVLRRDRGFIWWASVGGHKYQVGLGTMTHKDASLFLRKTLWG